jgi:hypothetical protein
LVKHPKYHWPPPSPEFVPDGWLTTFQAFNLVGRAQFPQTWMDGKELAALSDGEIQGNREADVRRKARLAETKQKVVRAKKASAAVVTSKSLPQFRIKKPRARSYQPVASYQGPPFPFELLGDDKCRRKARARGDKVWEEISQWLCAGTVPAAYLDDQGDLLGVAERNWRRSVAMRILLTGEGTVDGIPGPVLISRAHLETAIRGDSGIDQTPAEDQSTPDDSVTTPTPAIAANTSEKVTAPDSGEPKSKRPGRPSCGASIRAAYKELRTEGKVNLRSKKANYPTIREKLTGSPHITSAGLGDDAIRKAMGPLFDEDRAKKKGSL